MADRHPAWDRIEPEASELARHHDLIPGEHAIELSKAISLKRLADMLKNPTTKGGYFEDLAYLMGQAFQRGARSV